MKKTEPRLTTYFGSCCSVSPTTNSGLVDPTSVSNSFDLPDSRGVLKCPHCRQVARPTPTLLPHYNHTTPPYTLHYTPYTLHYSPQYTHSTLTHSTLIFGATCRPWGHLRTPLASINILASIIIDRSHSSVVNDSSCSSK